jgi:DNA-binding MarR family transcriptional regulator
MGQARKLAPLSASVGYVLKQASVALHGAMDAALRPLGLTVSQYACLEHLSRTPDQSNAELARAIFVTPQSMNDVLRGLENRDLVRRASEGPAGRARPAQITAAGRDALAKARLAIAPVEQRLLDSMPTASRSRILSDLHAIFDTLT